MDQRFPRKLQLWEGPTAAAVQDRWGLVYGERPVSGEAKEHGGELARKLYAYEALNPPARLIRKRAPAEPYSLQWFLDIENYRHGRQGRWIPRLLEFEKHAGETLLGLGEGLGTDWLQYARNDASVVVCCPSSSQLGLIRRNFELRGLSGRFLHAQVTGLPLEAASIDVVCIRDLLHSHANPQQVMEEVYRVLKPGGKVLAVVPARYDVDFWFDTCFFWYRWLERRRGPMPEEPRFSARGLTQLFARFAVHRVHKRQLRRSDVPHVWRWLPLPVLARLMGRVLVLKAFKPLSVAIGAVQAEAA
jgi:ubiquinone/menaquinone biosynthesis C-methylase UbiE